jgi:DNA (cytosine-5)-methyltransferase 1
MIRPPLLRASFEIQPDELVVDNFAGGGGASTGIRAGLTRPVDIAINHDAAAIAMHEANHPETKHYRENILEIDPVEVCRSRRVGLVWFSPDCTHFSKAKGTKPLSKEIRGLAWVVIDWARKVRPRVMFLENVEEFQTWGPLDDEGHPIKERAGETFRQWLSQLVDLGYDVEFRTLVAADFGAPTIRKRLFLVARCDGLPIVWPEATHGLGRAHAWRAAAEIIDWSIPCPSIFGRKRKLAEATLRRIAMGLRKYVINSAQPFILPVTHQGDSRTHGIYEPMRTVTAAHRGEFALATPVIVGAGGPSYSGKPRSVDQPLGTVVAENHRALVTPFVVRHGHYSTKTGAGLREGCGAGTFRGQKLEDPLATICGTEDKHIICPLISKMFGGPNGHSTPGHDIRSPLSTVTIKDHHRLTAAFLTKYYGSAGAGAPVTAPVPTITSGGKRGGGHIGAVRAFLTKYYGANGRPQTADLFDPLHTVTTKARFGLVMIHGEPYQIVDIGMRMLATRELFGAQGFPDEYIIDPLLYGKPLNKTQQTALAGNSVCPDVAEAIVAANTRERGQVAA